MVKRITKRHLLAALCAAALLVTQLFVFRPMASEAQAAQPIPLWMQETDSIPVNEAGYCSVNIVFEQTDVSGMAYLEFDYFVKDYEAFMANNEASLPAFIAKPNGNWDNHYNLSPQITASGWNHVKMELNAFTKSAPLSSLFFSVLPEAGLKDPDGLMFTRIKNIQATPADSDMLPYLLAQAKGKDTAGATALSLSFLEKAIADAEAYMAGEMTPIETAAQIESLRIALDNLVLETDTVKRQLISAYYNLLPRLEAGQGTATDEVWDAFTQAMAKALADTYVESEEASAAILAELQASCAQLPGSIPEPELEGSILLYDDINRCNAANGWARGEIAFPAADISGMAYLEFDFFVYDLTAFNQAWEESGMEAVYLAKPNDAYPNCYGFTEQVVQNGWNHIKIPLKHFPEESELSRLVISITPEGSVPDLDGEFYYLVSDIRATPDNVTTLPAMIDKAKATNTQGMTASSVAFLNEAIAEAEAYAAGDMEENEAGELVDRLYTAIFWLRSEANATDKEKLQSDYNNLLYLYEAGQGIVTGESWEAFANAMEAAAADIAQMDEGASAAILAELQAAYAELPDLDFEPEPALEGSILLYDGTYRCEAANGWAKSLIEFPAADISGMAYLEFDFFVYNLTAFNEAREEAELAGNYLAKPNDLWPDCYAFNEQVIQNGWNHIKIPLSHFEAESNISTLGISIEPEGKVPDLDGTFYYLVSDIRATPDNVTTLPAMIDKAKATNTQGMTASSVAFLNEAIAEAEAYAAGDMEDEEAGKLVDRLYTAIFWLRPEANATDKEKLQSDYNNLLHLYKQGQGIFTDETWKAFDEAMQAAAADIALMEEEASVAVLAQLQAAYAGLEDKGLAVQIGDVLAEIESLIEEGQWLYSDATWNAMITAYEEAKAQEDNFVSMADNELQALLDRLNEAIAALTIEYKSRPDKDSFYLSDCEMNSSTDTWSPSGVEYDSEIISEGHSSVTNTFEGTTLKANSFSLSGVESWNLQNGKSLRFDLYIDDIELFKARTKLMAQLSSDSRGREDYIQWDLTKTPGYDSLKEGWNSVELSFAEAETVGSPDLSAVRMFTLGSLAASFEEGESLKLNLDNIRVYGAAGDNPVSPEDPDEPGDPDSSDPDDVGNVDTGVPAGTALPAALIGISAAALLLLKKARRMTAE